MPKIKVNYRNPEHLEMLDQFREKEIADIEFNIREMRTEIFRLFALLYEHKNTHKNKKHTTKKSK